MSDIDQRAQVAAEFLASAPQHLESYFKVYDGLLARNDVHVLQLEEPGPQECSPVTYEDILVAAKVLRSDSTLTLKQATEQLGTELNRTHSQQQLRVTVLIAVRCMLMLDSAVSGRVWEPWQPDERFVDFVSKCFPKSLGLSSQAAQAMKDRKSLKAWKLKARSGITFKGTDNLAQHLLLDPASSVLYLFRHAAFLKAQLGRLQEGRFGKEDDVSKCLQIGSLPPRLLAETLHSFQAVLFHFDDHRSSKILERLIRKKDFDEDCAQPEGYKMFDDTGSFDYLYWGERLAALHEFVQNRPPRNKLERWIKWQTSESNAFLVAIAALIISIVIGLLTLALAVIQTWIAWKAWKEPVSNADNTAVNVEQLVRRIQERVNNPER